MKSVLLSIKPKYCELIASGKKTVEIRKTRPKIDTPFKCYIYCTLTGKNEIPPNEFFRGKWYKKKGKVIGEFVCDSIDKYSAEFCKGKWYEDIRFHYTDIDKEDQEIIVTANDRTDPNNCYLCGASCLSFEDIKKYIGETFHDKLFYGWHISDLVIYDEPKGLSEFSLKRPPQSWCYVEECGK